MNSDFTHYYLVLRKLEELEIPYVVIGAFAGTMYGVMRSTNDVDILVNLDESRVNDLAAAFPSPRYYADPQQMLGAIRAHSTFNIIDALQAKKADLFMLSMDPRYLPAFDTRTRHTMTDNNGELFDVWFARVEDVIVGKLMAWAGGRSYRHMADIYEMMVFHYLDEQSSLEPPFDEEYIDDLARGLGDEVMTLWQAVKAAARQEARRARS